MSAASRQRTCAACGAGFAPGERTEVEVLLDGAVRYVAVHPGHSTFPPLRLHVVPRRGRPARVVLDSDEFDGYDVFDHGEAA
jgi:hypothetical protein